VATRIKQSSNISARRPSLTCIDLLGIIRFGTYNWQPDCYSPYSILDRHFFLLRADLDSQLLWVGSMSGSGLCDVCLCRCRTNLGQLFLRQVWQSLAHFTTTSCFSDACSNWQHPASGLCVLCSRRRTASYQRQVAGFGAPARYSGSRTALAGCSFPNVSMAALVDLRRVSA